MKSITKENKFPLISIIVPAWNEEKYLPLNIQALQRQDYPNYEIIVVNNNSSDGTERVLRKYDVKVLFEKRQGITYARQKGFSEAKGEYIAKIDADTIPEKNWLSSLYNEIKNSEEIVAVTASSRFYDGGLLLSYISKIFFNLVIYLVFFTTGHYPLNGPNYLIRKRVVKNIKPHFNDSLIHEDMDLSCHLSLYGKIVFKPRIVVNCSARRLFKNPLFIFKYLKKSIITYLLHHPFHKLHRFN